MHQTAEQELISDAHVSDHKKQQLIPKSEILHISNHDQNNQTKQKLLTIIKTKINTYLNKKIINKKNQ